MKLNPYLTVYKKFPVNYRSKCFPGGTSGRESAATAGNARDMISIPGSGSSPAVGNGDLLQNSCLENSMDRK